MIWKHVGCLVFATENGTRIKRQKIKEMVNKQNKSIHMLTRSVCYTSLYRCCSYLLVYPHCVQSMVHDVDPAVFRGQHKQGHQSLEDTQNRLKWTHGIMGVVVVIDKQIVIAVEHLFEVTQAFMQGNVSKLHVLFQHVRKLPSSIDIHYPPT